MRKRERLIRGEMEKRVEDDEDDDDDEEGEEEKEGGRTITV